MIESTTHLHPPVSASDPRMPDHGRDDFIRLTAGVRAHVVIELVHQPSDPIVRVTDAKGKP
jgi:hypothetical protein